MGSEDVRMRTVAGVRVTKIGFASADGKTQIKGLIWTPEAVKISPKAIVQITHGMEEHIGRYVDFANFLVSQGFVVCGSDMLGHGLSIGEEDRLSCLPAENGRDVLIEDAHELRKIVASRFSQQTPYFMFGHSLGSYVMQAYLSCYGEGLSGAILCGTGQLSKVLSHGGNMVAKLIVRFKGEDHRSSLLESMGVGAYARAIENPRTDLDWLSCDPQVVDEYIADPLCGVAFSAGAYVVTTALTKEAADLKKARRIPEDLPVFFIAGEQDPVGDKGKGVKRAAELLRQAEVRHVDVRLYEGMRHEILNEPGKEDVYTDIVRWIEGVIEKR